MLRRRRVRHPVCISFSRRERRMATWVIILDKEEEDEIVQGRYCGFWGGGGDRDGGFRVRGPDSGGTGDVEGEPGGKSGARGSCPDPSTPRQGVPRGPGAGA